MMPIYIDANVFYNAYCPIEDRITADWHLKQISTEFPGITSEWTIAEIFRAFKRQVNLDRIEAYDAEIAIDLFLSEIGEYSQKNKLILIPAKYSLIMASRPLIFTQNLYAADAIHAITAIQMKVDAFIMYETDFTELKNIPILNPSQENFQNSISLIKTKYSEEKEK